MILILSKYENVNKVLNFFTKSGVAVSVELYIVYFEYYINIMQKWADQDNFHRFDTCINIAYDKKEFLVNAWDSDARVYIG